MNREWRIYFSQVSSEGVGNLSGICDRGGEWKCGSQGARPAGWGRLGWRIVSGWERCEVSSEGCCEVMVDGHFWVKVEVEHSLEVVEVGHLVEVVEVGHFVEVVEVGRLVEN